MESGRLAAGPRPRAGWAGRRGRSTLLRASLPSVPPPPPPPRGGPRAARAGGGTVLPPLLWEPRELRAPARGPAPFPHSYKPQPTPFPDPLFQPPSQTQWQFSPQGLGVLDSFPDQPFLIKGQGLGWGRGWRRGKPISKTQDSTF